MTGPMPARLEEWLWRAQRIRAGRTELTRRDAEAARTALLADRSAFRSRTTASTPRWPRFWTRSRC